jgi:hypothetical protein
MNTAETLTISKRMYTCSMGVSVATLENNYVNEQEVIENADLREWMRINLQPRGSIVKNIYGS